MLWFHLDLSVLWSVGLQSRAQTGNQVMATIAQCDLEEEGRYRSFLAVEFLLKHWLRSWYSPPYTRGKSDRPTTYICIFLSFETAWYLDGQQLNWQWFSMQCYQRIAPGQRSCYPGECSMGLPLAKVLEKTALPHPPPHSSWPQSQDRVAKRLGVWGSGGISYSCSHTTTSGGGRGRGVGGVVLLTTVLKSLLWLKQ